MFRKTLTLSLAILCVAGFAGVAAADDAAPAVVPNLDLANGGECISRGEVVDFAPVADTAGKLDPLHGAEQRLGCTASYNCVHGTIVSCSSPLIGTCESSGQHCGRVTCNGVTTWCPGACYFAHHCIRFCDPFEYPNSYCDNTDCCVCQ